jgi:hypothetical protein
MKHSEDIVTEQDANLAAGRKLVAVGRGEGGARGEEKQMFKDVQDLTFINFPVFGYVAGCLSYKGGRKGPKGRSAMASAIGRAPGSRRWQDRGIGPGRGRGLEPRISDFRFLLSAFSFLLSLSK